MYTYAWGWGLKLVKEKDSGIYIYKKRFVRFSKTSLNLLYFLDNLSYNIIELTNKEKKYDSRKSNLNHHHPGPYQWGA